MKNISIVILLFLIFPLYSKSQDINNLYEYAIEMHINTHIKEKYIAEEDSIYIFCGFCDCHGGGCYGDYDININDSRVIFGLPNVDSKNSSAFAWKIHVPSIHEKYIIISLTSYTIVYENDVNLINTGTTSYFFEYSSLKKKYVFHKREEYNL